MNDTQFVASDGRESVLRTEHLRIQFGGLRAVDDVNLEIKKGELYGLIGPNGAGKTTVFNLLTGVYKPTSGKIFLCGKDITGKAPAEINRLGIARTFQNIRLFNNLTVIENVMVGLSNSISCNIAQSIFRLPRHKKSEKEFYERALELLKVFQLDEYKDYLAANLPYGKQRKLEIARAMATNPTLLLLDEPAAGMNPNETQELMDDITFVRKNFGMTILLIEHDMRLVSGICENLTVLNFGTELAKGETAKVLSDPAVVKAYLGE
ncbi:MAG: ABC transporter ATP-binding protein [Clostridia bacterium]|nr:ABC transporter ATP-binding protein [Clostridia bacterium]